MIKFKIARPLLFLLAASSLLSFSHCGSNDSFDVWSESVVGAIGGAIITTRSTGLMARALPTSTVVCPSIVNTSVDQAACRAMVNDAIHPTTPGEYLRRPLLLCQFALGSDPAWWRTYHNIKFPTQAICNAIKGSTDAFTAANLTSSGLLGGSVTLEYGMGGNGDQNNQRFASNGEVLFLNTTFPSGWTEARKGGTVVTFHSTTERRLFIGGVHSEGYQTIYENVRNPTDLFNDLSTKPKADVVKVRWDRTINSQAVNDRLYEQSAVEADGVATANSLVVVQTVSGFPVAKAGSLIKTQHNIRRSLGISTISVDLKFGDSTCCWPTEGELTTDFVSFYNLPSTGGKAFTKEKLLFTAGSACGAVTLTQSGGDLGDAGKTRTAQLYHCQ